MVRTEEKLTPIKIKTWESWTVSGCLDERVGGNQVHMGKSTHIKGYSIMARGYNSGALDSVPSGREV